jgi:hypothetical protein
MINIMELLSRIIFHDLSPSPAPKGPTFIRLAANMAAFFSVVFGYVLGCRVLYHYLKPIWGEEMSLLAICALLFTTSVVLFGIAWLVKPKKPQPTNLVSAVEKTISEIPTHEIIEKVASLVSPKAVMAVFTVAAIASYFSNFNKKDI